MRLAPVRRFACLAALLLLVGTPVPGQTGNPVPQIGNLYPSAVPAGIGQVRLTVGDAGHYSFVNGSVVHWNGSPRPTVWRIETVCPGFCANWLETTLFASDVINQGVATITVVNPGPGGGTSAARLFTIEAPATRFFTVSPCRLFDSRIVRPGFPGNGVPLHAPQRTVIPSAGYCGIPTTGARALVINVTVVDPTHAGHVTFFPSYTFPSSSSINYRAGQTRAQQAIVGVDEYGNVGMDIAQPTGFLDLILDVSGYFE